MTYFFIKPAEDFMIFKFLPLTNPNSLIMIKTSKYFFVKVSEKCKVKFNYHTGKEEQVYENHCML